MDLGAPLRGKGFYNPYGVVRIGILERKSKVADLMGVERIR